MFGNSQFKELCTSLYSLRNSLIITTDTGHGHIMEINMDSVRRIRNMSDYQWDTSLN